MNRTTIEHVARWIALAVVGLTLSMAGYAQEKVVVLFESKSSNRYKPTDPTLTEHYTGRVEVTGNSVSGYVYDGWEVGESFTLTGSYDGTTVTMSATDGFAVYNDVTLLAAYNEFCTRALEAVKVFFAARDAAVNGIISGSVSVADLSAEQIKGWLLSLPYPTFVSMLDNMSFEQLSHLLSKVASSSTYYQAVEDEYRQKSPPVEAPYYTGDYWGYYYSYWYYDYWYYDYWYYDYWYYYNAYNY